MEFEVPMTLPSIGVKQAIENLDVDTVREGIKPPGEDLNDCSHF